MYTTDDNGFILIQNNPISKSGVFQYLGKNISPQLDPDKIYNVYRSEQELDNPETIASFKLAPWIPYHEMLGDKYTAPENVGVQGVTGEDVYFSNGTLYSNLKLFGENLKASIKAGLKELSCGFGCKWTVQSGVAPGGQRYDAIQTEIRGNHLASVPQGRMGSDVRVSMDRAVFALDHLMLNQDGESTMDEKQVKALFASALEPITQALDAAEKKQEATDKKFELFKKKSESDKDDDDKKKEKSAEDMEAEKEKEAKDKEKSKAMDSAIDALTKEVETLKSNAMDGHALMKAYAEKQELANQSASIVGAFDHSDMDSNGVAKYVLDKIGMACDSGQELSMLKGVLHAHKAPVLVADKGNAQDAALKSDVLDEMGL